MIKPCVDLESPLVFEEIIAVLQKILDSRGITIFTIIEHHKAAEAVGESVSPATVLIVGNPKIGTALMRENPRFVIEFPLKISTCEENETVKVRYEKIAAMDEKCHIRQTFSTIEKIDIAMPQLVKSLTGEQRAIISAALLHDSRIITHEYWVVKGLTIVTPAQELDSLVFRCITRDPRPLVFYLSPKKATYPMVIHILLAVSLSPNLKRKNDEKISSIVYPY